MPDSWWSLSKTSLASAIGLKSKKYRQDPVLTNQCHSLLTLSDSDPFAGVPKRTPLSVDTAILHSISCPSSDSLSTTACDPSTPSKNADPTGSCKLSNKQSMNDIQFSRSAAYNHPSPCSKRPGSSSTVVTGHSTLLKPKLRARGMTDSGGTKKAGFFSDEQPPIKKLSKKLSTSTFSPSISSTEPRVVIQQPSLSRLTAPPCAPPAHSLPATPLVPSCPMPWSNRFARTESVSSSCISFVSSSSNEILPVLPCPSREERHSDRSMFSQVYDPELFSTTAKRESKTAPSSPRTLRKAISHQSLSGKSNIQPPALLPKLSPDNMMDKVFRKQKNPPRSSMRPILLDSIDQPSSGVSTTMPLPDFGRKTAPERRASSFGRKRMFSHSNATRPSTSHCTPTPAMTEDDARSVFSLRSDHGSYVAPLRPWASPKMAPQSSWDEAGSIVSSSPTRSNSEYTPQHILSAAEVAKLEASIENSPDRYTRSRAFSHLSASTTTSDRENLDFMPAGLSPPPSRPRSKQGGLTTKSLAPKNLAFHSPVPSRARSPPRSPPPPNPESNTRNPIAYQSFSSESPVECAPATSLPPPPRLRQWPQPVPYPEYSNTAPSNSPSIAKPSRSREKNVHRQSIMKKPSFLEIDDDTDQDTREATTESFLDLARESFEASS